MIDKNKKEMIENMLKHKLINNKLKQLFEIIKNSYQNQF